ncbi:MAG TPA: carboxymuconolactone decarboxylase family protein, partial [Solirubrobacteraceae bacterium]|nr:carboxymuconolactone decarboxylase family protein [Solirubrobacteraceae bacterium]
MITVSQDTQDALAGISDGDMELLEATVGLREAHLERTGLDPKSFALVKIAALIALGAPTASYAWQIANSRDEGVSPEEILGVLRAVAP